MPHTLRLASSSMRSDHLVGPARRRIFRSSVWHGVEGIYRSERSEMTTAAPRRSSPRDRRIGRLTPAITSRREIPASPAGNAQERRGTSRASPVTRQVRAHTQRRRQARDEGYSSAATGDDLPHRIAPGPDLGLCAEPGGCIVRSRLCLSHFVLVEGLEESGEMAGLEVLGYPARR